MDRRIVAVVLAAGCAGFALGWMVGAQGGTDEASEPARRATPGDEPARATLEGSAPRAAPSPSDAVVPESSATTSAAEPVLDPHPELHVRVVDADGAPVHTAAVYALPAGAPGVQDEGAVAQAWVSAEGRCVLRVPAAGTYDVGVVVAYLGGARDLQTDVVVPLGRELTLRVGPVADLEVVATRALLDRLRPTVPAAAGKSEEVDGVMVTLTTVEDGTRATSYPGRADEGYGQVSVRLSRDVPRTAVKMPRGRRLRVTQSDARIPVAATPTALSSPGTVELAPAGAAITGQIRFLPPERSFPRDVAVQIRVQTGDQTLGTHDFRIPAGQPIGEIRSIDRWRVPVDEGTLSWSGEGVSPGSVSFRAGSDGEAGVDVAVVVENPPARRQPDVASELSGRRVRVSAADASNLPDVGVHVLGHFSLDFEWDQARAQGTGVVAGDWTWIAAYASVDDVLRWASAPVSAASGSGDIVLELRPGGHLLAMPDRALPSGMYLQIERADGLPLMVAGELDVGPRIVEPGLVIGPIEPGLARFAVRLAGMDLGVVEARVRAGGYAPLVLPTAPARR